MTLFQAYRNYRENFVTEIMRGAAMTVNGYNVTRPLQVHAQRGWPLSPSHL